MLLCNYKETFFLNFNIKYNVTVIHIYGIKYLPTMHGYKSYLILSVAGQSVSKNEPCDVIEMRDYTSLLKKKKVAHKIFRRH